MLVFDVEVVISIILSRRRVFRPTMLLNKFAVVVFGWVLFGAEEEHVLAKMSKSIDLCITAILRSLRINQIASSDEHARSAFLDVLVVDQKAAHLVVQLHVPVQSIVELALLYAI